MSNLNVGAAGHKEADKKIMSVINDVIGLARDRERAEQEGHERWREGHHGFSIIRMMDVEDIVKMTDPEPGKRLTEYLNDLDEKTLVALTEAMLEGREKIYYPSYSVMPISMLYQAGAKEFPNDSYAVEYLTSKRELSRYLSVYLNSTSNR